MTEKCEHCSTVLRTFVQDLNGFEVMQLFSWGGGGSFKPPGLNRVKIR